MTPAARTQAAIELLDAIIAAARDHGPAADTLIGRYFAVRRYAGSKDRRAVRALVYAAVRAAGERPESGRAALLLLAKADPAVAATFDGSPHGPAAIAPGERIATAGVAPAWLAELLAASGIDTAGQHALIDRAPLDVRVNTLLADPAAVATEIGGRPIAGLSAALRLPAGTDIAPVLGRVEVQDAGSQLVTLAVDARPGQTVVDLCAGAGGKSLALAAAMVNDGRIVACDTDRGRLSRLPMRAQKADARIIETLLLDPDREREALAGWQGRADAVLVDAPCSGTGTWRRNPEARWRLNADRLARFAATQARLLDIAAPLLRSGGALVYVVCSLLDVEGADQAAAFAARSGWAAEQVDLSAGCAHGAGWRLDPAHDDTDGFFVARFRAP
ncbi:RsmB/NOP family class I SAM-dependent RNA methyltransferase [Sphingomonas sp.]|uniref:RsmB/NOP family class I SAM-dependent RNA methyltransferase n=1 Tax=Sphingomonas sp. TaxID=28214 RepID=UPI003CC52093